MPPTRKSLQIAARIWGDFDFSHVEMDAEAATEIAVILDRILAQQGKRSAMDLNPENTSAVCEMLMPFLGETNESEGAVDVLKRLLDELKNRRHESAVIS